MTNVIAFPRAAARHVAVHRYEGALVDRFLLVLVEADGKWTERSPYLSDRDEAGEIASTLAAALGVRLEPSVIRAGTWTTGGAA